jgi:hypothetical protein
MELFKRKDRYDLYHDNGHKVASSAPNPFGKLSKQNCDELFGVVDVEKLVDIEYPNPIDEDGEAHWDSGKLHHRKKRFCGRLSKSNGVVSTNRN